MDWDPDERDGAVRLPVDVGSAGFSVSIVAPERHTPKQEK